MWIVETKMRFSLSSKNLFHRDVFFDDDACPTTISLFIHFAVSSYKGARFATHLYHIERSDKSKIDIYIHTYSALTLKDKKRRSYPEHEAAAHIFVSRMITDTHGDNR
jgi:hypothetical protein